VRAILLANKNFKDINPMECGEEYCATNFRAGPTSRQYYLLHYVFSGKGSFFTNGNEYSVSKGQIFIMHPFELVHYKAMHNDPWHYSWIGFEMSIESPTLDNNSILDIPQAEHIFHLIKGSDQIENQRELYLCGKIFDLLSMLEQPKITKISKTDDYIKKAKQYIDINYMHPITIDQIAGNLNINRSYFSTIFRKCMGKSPQQYLLDIRMENAAELITNHNYSISDAAMSSGYSDIFNFSKMFKSKFGVSPAYYAKRRKS
jgi:AraC-like DNA-binding protein